ncbi:MAG: T9SS type A sorting domain-containing protein [Saprospiraceae bacterium]|nr:T9SS type A sorting domain-containing protein [Saprospiraceae bacterium]MDZ4705543.1 T9SS type A sorting domain-containing protein [Saprospiraceae bacterium]
MKSTIYTLRATLSFALTIFCLFAMQAQIFVVNGDASSLGNECFQITPAQNNQAGSVWSQNKISLANDFEFRADLNFGNKDSNGADGIAFVFQPVCTGLGSLGGGIGYQGIAPSLAVEYDTYQNSVENNDPIQDHIALQRNGVLFHAAPSMLAGVSLLPNIENGANHSTVISWDAGAQVLSVLFDGVLQFSYNGDIVADIFGGNPEVFWGFTAATGALNNDQRVCITDVVSTELTQYVVTDASCVENADGAIDFTASPGVTFAWSNGETTEDISNLLPGIYTLSVTDANGCASTYLIEVGVALDLVQPAIVCPSGASVSCGDDFSPVSLGMATGTDNCLGTLVTFSDSETPASCANGAIVRTWTATDLAGNTATCLQNIAVIGDDIAPVCLNCPGDVTVSCDNIPDLPILEVTDNCDSAPAISLISTTSQTGDGSCGDYSYTISRVVTVTDQCGNAQSYPQTVTVVDEIAPVLTCPADTTISCDELDLPGATGTATALDNCDPAPAVTWEDNVVSGDCDWECLIERTWKVVDACGNVSVCVQNITSTSVFLLEEALSVDTDGDGLPNPLVLGVSRNKLTLKPGAGACIIEWMPSMGDSSTSLRTAQLVIDGADCSIAPNLINADGKSRNPLLEAGLKLSVKVRLDPAYGNRLLSQLEECIFHPIVYQYMPPNPDVNDLLRLANLGLGNIIGPPHLNHLLNALRCINGTYDICDPAEMDMSFAAPGGQLPSTLVDVHKPMWTVFPNPASGNVFADLSQWADQSVELELVNASGQVMQVMHTIAPDAPLRIEVAGYPAGLYFLRVKTGSGVGETVRFVIGGR